MLAPLLALALCILASLSGTVLAQPVLTAYGVPPGVLRLVPVLLFACSLAPPVLLSGDWLWLNGTRRSGPPRRRGRSPPACRAPASLWAGAS